MDAPRAESKGKRETLLARSKRIIGKQLPSDSKAEDKNSSNAWLDIYQASTDIPGRSFNTDRRYFQAKGSNLESSEVRATIWSL